MTSIPSEPKDRSLDVENSFILLSKGSFIESSSINMITLKHPGYDKRAKFLINKSTKEVFEIQTFDEKFRSWLIDDTLRTNGNLYVSTPIDALFIVLPHVKEQCIKRAVPMEHIFNSASDPNLIELFECVKDLNAIADLKGPPALSAYRYNEEKTLKWLEIKTKRVADLLKKKNIHVKKGAVSSTFVTSSLKEDDVDDESYMKYAYGIVCEYLNEEFCTLLNGRLNFKAETETVVKRKSEYENEIDLKKFKSENNDDTAEELQESKTECRSEFFELSNAKTKSSPVKKLSAKEKQKLKAATGTKSITSFFTKK